MHDTESIVGEDLEIGLTEVLRVFLRYWVLIVACFTLSAIGSVFIALNLTPFYRSQVLLSPVSENESGGALSSMANQFSGIASLAGISLSQTSSFREDSLATLRSRAFTVEFLEDVDALPLLFYENWDSTRNSWDIDDADDIPTIGDGFRVFNEQVRGIREDNDTGLVTMSIELADREKAAEWANLLVARANEQIKQRAIREAESSIEFLNETLEETSVVELQQAIFRLIETQLNSIMLARTREEYAFKVIDPAVPSDPDDEVRPNKRLIVMAGSALGGFIGMLLALILSARRQENRIK